MTDKERFDHTIRLVDMIKAYLTNLDMSGHDTLDYWCKAATTRPEDLEVQFRKIVMNEVVKNQRVIIQNIFKMISEATDIPDLYPFNTTKTD